MTLQIDTARDAVIALIDTAWKASGAASENVPMQYDNVKSDAPGELVPPGTGQAGPYARTSVRTISSPQSTQGRRRFLTTGDVTVQIFTPAGDGHTLGDALAKVPLAALRQHVGSADSLWFFDIVPQEIGIDGAHFQTNVTASLRYQEDP